MARITFENEGLVSLFDDLSRSVPEKIPQALEAMAAHLERKLRLNAPYDGSPRHKDKHLREVISHTDVRASSKSGSRERYITVFVKPRGIRGAVKGKNARQNWDADKHVFKLVVAEYGSSKQPAKPFWKPTVEREENNVLKEGTDVLLDEVDRIVNS